MSLHIRKSVASLFRRSPIPCCDSNVGFSLSLIYFSTRTGTQPAAAPVINLKDYNFSPQVVARATSVLSRSRYPERPNSVLLYLRKYGFTDVQMEKIVKSKPNFLVANVEKIEPKIKILQDIGLKPPEIADIISWNPAIMYSSTRKTLMPSISQLKDLMGSNAAVVKILRRCSWFLLMDWSETMARNVEFLKSCGLCRRDIVQKVNCFPRFILLNPETMKKSVEKVDKMGFSRSSRNFIHALGVVASLSQRDWDLKMKTYQKFGFSEDQVLELFRKEPLTFAVSGDKIGNMIKLILATGKYTTLCIYRCPKSLMYSIETRYKPRLCVLDVLEKKNLIKKWPSLRELSTTSKTRFFGTYVRPYLSEVSDMRMASVELDLMFKIVEA